MSSLNKIGTSSTQPTSANKPYWEKCSLVLGIAVVFDPRCKMAIVKYYYDKIYGSDSYEHVKRVRDALFALFDDYRGNCNDSNSFTCDEDDGSVLLGSSQDDKLGGFHKWYMQASYNDLRVTQKSELDMYLDEPLIMRKGKEYFNILDWWKCNSVQVPILARIALDVLAVPATTVASESAFSIGGRVIDDTRASLLPDVVEALVTTLDWIPSK